MRGCCPPTSPWKASSPTWWRPEHVTVAWITPAALFGRRRFCCCSRCRCSLIGLAALPGHRRDPADMGNAGVRRRSASPWCCRDRADRRHRRPRLGVDDGTLVHILAKPLPRSEIMLAKLGVAFG